MIKYILYILLMFTVSSCGYKDFPFSETTYNGIYSNSLKLSDKDIKRNLLNVCDKLPCKVLSSSYDKPGGGFMLIIKVDKNEEVTFFKDSRDVIFFMITQRKKSEFKKLTLDILNESKRIGFEFKLIHLEEWICNGEKLTFEDCTRKDTKYDNLDYIDFVKSKLSEK